MSLEQQAFVLWQACIHPLVRPIAKSAGLVDNNNFMIKNYIMNNMKRSLLLAQEANNKKAHEQMMIQDHFIALDVELREIFLQFIKIYLITHFQMQ